VQDVVLALLFAGADTSLKDARGFDVMIEGARGSREDIIDVLRRSGARTGISIMLQVCALGADLCALTRLVTTRVASLTRRGAGV
jgi:hypothetical protein